MTFIPDPATDLGAPILNTQPTAPQPVAPDTDAQPPDSTGSTGGGAPVGPSASTTPATPAAPRTFGGDFKGGFKSAANPQRTIDPNTGAMTRTNPPQGAGGLLGSLLFGALLGAQHGLAAQTPPGAKTKSAAFSAGARAAEDASDEKQVQAQKAAQLQLENKQAIIRFKDAHNQSLMTQIEAVKRMADAQAQLPLIVKKLNLETEDAQARLEINRQALADHQRQIGEDIDNYSGVEPVGRIDLAPAEPTEPADTADDSSAPQQ